MLEKGSISRAAEQMLKIGVDPTMSVFPVKDLVPDNMIKCYIVKGVSPFK